MKKFIKETLTEKGNITLIDVNDKIHSFTKLVSFSETDNVAIFEHTTGSKFAFNLDNITYAY